MAESLESLVTLNSGHNMPYFGLGCFKVTYDAVRHALKVGYRLIDTAEYYGTEAECGRAIQDSGIARDQIFVTSKLWNSHRGYDQARKAFFDSFKKLGLEYVDLYLIHSPLGKNILPTYDALVDLQKEGYIRSVGVSNFGIHHLEGIKEAGRPPPAVNQIELHCFNRQEKLVEYCQDKNIVVHGYSPIAKGRHFSDPTLVAMAEKYQKSVVQIMIRWSVQKEFVTIPRSGNPAHIEHNADVFDFKLDQKDMQKLDHCTHHVEAWQLFDEYPTVVPWTG